MTTWEGKESSDGDLDRELHILQREKTELKSRNEALQDAVRKLEADRRLPRPSVLRSKSHERTEKNVYYSDFESGKLLKVHTVPLPDTCSEAILKLKATRIVP